MAKDVRREYTIPMEQRLLWFIAHLHLTPQGMVDLFKRYKSPRPVFDSSSHPQAWCLVINDWTSKDNEPAVTFADSVMICLTWIWNLRITYPNKEIYPLDDDVSGAFRHNKHNLFLVAMHAFVILGMLFLNTGSTFGGNTSPGNWDIVSQARRILARFLWAQGNIIQRAAKYLPILNLVEPPPGTIFAQASADALNQGVLNPDGSRQPPPYPHHVDDNLYADIADYVD